MRELLLPVARAVTSRTTWGSVQIARHDTTSYRLLAASRSKRGKRVNHATCGRLGFQAPTRKEPRGRPDRPAHPARPRPWRPPPSPGGPRTGVLAAGRGVATGRTAGRLAFAALRRLAGPRRLARRRLFTGRRLLAGRRRAPGDGAARGRRSGSRASAGRAMGSGAAG